MCVTAAFLAERQRLERGSRVEPRLDVLPVNDSDSGTAPADRAPARRRSWRAPVRGPCARAPSTSSGSETNTVGRAGQRQVVEERRRSIGFVGSAGKLGQRNDGGLVDCAGRSLRRGVIGADGLDRVADELESDRALGAGRIEIDDPAADAELARLVNGILARVAGAREKIAEIYGRDFVTGRDRSARP